MTVQIIAKSIGTLAATPSMSMDTGISFASRTRLKLEFTFAWSLGLAG
jgi:hypothetical protein